MEDRHQQIKQYLQKAEVQKRIKEEMTRAREEAMVTISNASSLFGFSENQLRDWDKNGLLSPQRRVQDAEQDGKGARRRQYTSAELNKLAIIHELLEKGNFSIGTIPPYVDEMWDEVASKSELQEHTSRVSDEKVKHVHIDSYAYVAYKEYFWRYYAYQAMRLSIMLICEGLPPIPAGLILPAHHRKGIVIRKVEELQQLGSSLIGWLGQTRTFYTYVTDYPSFEYPSDYKAISIQSDDENNTENRTWIVLDREAAKHLIAKNGDLEKLNLSSEIINTVQRLLAPLYEDTAERRRFFGEGMRNFTNPAMDFESGLVKSDSILSELANMTIRLGNKDSWRFCCLLMPKDTSLPVTQRTLVVKVISKKSPHEIGTTVSPDRYINSPSLKAFQSGYVIYRPEISATDSAIALRQLEEPLGSVIALPVDGDNEEPIAVLYIASCKKSDFSLEDQYILRMIGKMFKELLMIYYARLQTVEKLRHVIDRPSAIDSLFEDFPFENDFNSDVERLLFEIRSASPEGNLDDSSGNLLGSIQEYKADPYNSTEVVSFLSVNVDNQSELANMYGERVMRNIIREVGLRLRTFLRNHPDRKFYYVQGDKFYVFLKNVSLTEAQEKAQNILDILRGPYLIDALRISREQPLRTRNMIIIQDITVHLGVTSFLFSKLEDLLMRYSRGSSVIEVRDIISLELERSLEKGKDEGGNVVITWTPPTKIFKRLP